MTWHILIAFCRLVFTMVIVGALDPPTNVVTKSENGTDSAVKNASKNRIAMIMTLAGNRKLAQYFEWGCRTISASKSLIDMIVVHENNQQLKDMKCADNVKFVNLGERGLSEMVAKHILGQESNEDVVKQLVLVINNVLTHTPRYLVEIKPMTGSLFKDYISHYSHWTYTDPDIIWGDVCQWITDNDLEHYDIISFAKHFDAARLYLRGQFSVHRNVEGINNLWKKLPYFQHDNYASRMGTAYRMVTEHASADEVFKINFQSAEGWYSNLIFNEHLNVKIVGMAFDDFFREPVIWFQGNLARCPVTHDLTSCIHHIKESVRNNSGVVGIPSPKYEAVTVSKETTECKMRWLPVETRYCITESVYDKADALAQDQQQDVKLARKGEAVLENDKWQANDELTSPRQIREWGAFFHFRHWDDVISLRQESHFPNTKDGSIGCMVLYLKANYALAFEDCDGIEKNEKLGRITLGNVMKTRDGKQPVKEVLSRARWELEVGYHGDRSKKKKHKHGAMSEEGGEDHGGRNNSKNDSKVHEDSSSNEGKKKKKKGSKKQPHHKEKHPRKKKST